MSVRRKAADATTERILDAAFALLESGGPAATTISATARRAGVQRLTVYRRFADDEALMQAALERELRRDPPPDPSTWSAEPDRLERCRAALRAWFAWRGRRAALWSATASAHDAGGPVATFAAATEAARRRAVADLISHWPPAERTEPLEQVLGAVFGEGVRSALAGERCETDRAADLAVVWIEAAAY